MAELDFASSVGAWFLGVGGMWLWHAPALCNAAVTNVWVHRLQYVSLLLMGLAFWWPIIGPWTRQRLSPLAGMIYLFSACVGCTVLGIIITFSPVEVCSIYLHPAGPARHSVADSKSMGIDARAKTSNLAAC